MNLPAYSHFCSCVVPHRRRCRSLDASNTPQNASPRTHNYVIRLKRLEKTKKRLAQERKKNTVKKIFIGRCNKFKTDPNKPHFCQQMIVMIMTTMMVQMTIWYSLTFILTLLQVTGISHIAETTLILCATSAVGRSAIAFKQQRGCPFKDAFCVHNERYGTGCG